MTDPLQGYLYPYPEYNWYQLAYYTNIHVIMKLDIPINRVNLSN